MRHIFLNIKNDQRGNALMIVMVLFVVISLSIATGLLTPVLRANRIATNSIQSKQSYFMAESGVEDTLYRLLNTMQVNPIETLSLGTQSTTTVVNDLVGGEKQIQAVGDVNGRNRTISMILSQGAGVSFNYGVQTGRGGIVMGNNSEIIGNVYANGDITGSGSITETAVAANSAALVADQTNEIPATPTTSITFRDTASTQDFAQSFQLTNTSAINKIQVYIKKFGNPANATIRIVSDSSGKPGTNNLLTTQGTLLALSVSTSYGWIEVALPSNPTLYAGVTYWLVIDNSSNSTTNYYTIGANDAGYIAGTPKIGAYSGTWNNSSPSTLDGYFKIYLGGLTSQINGITVGTGTVGDAWAYTVTDGSVAGTKYCQVGVGCDTSRGDPPPTSFPVSDANIADWKSDATAGGTISGNYSPADGSTLGPKKITGNLTVTVGQVVTITGRVWVQGNVIVRNNSKVKLDTSYGTRDEVIVTDGYIDIGNNGEFQNSGTDGSYIMALTTSDCPRSVSCGGINAIDVSNNSGAVILNAQKGTIHVNNNADLVEATGETLVLDPNATITYQTGLTNTNFSSGPGGSWNIDLWREI